MTAPTQAWYWAAITFKDKKTGASSTIKVSSWYSSEATYLNVLLDVGGIGTRMNGTLATSISGSLEINNAPNSMGFQRRFSDLFDTLTCIDQAVTVYAAFTTDTDFLPDADKVKLFEGKIASCQFRGDRLTLIVDSRSVPKRIMTKVVDADSYPNAPSQSIGKHIPIVIGSNVEVAPVLVDTVSNYTWAFGTTLSTKHVNDGVQKYYCKHPDNQYYEVKTAPASNIVYQQAFNAGGFGTFVGFLEGGGNGYRELGNMVLDPVLFPTVGRYVVTGGRMKFTGTGNGAWAGQDGRITFRLYEYGPAGTNVQVGRLLGTAEVLKSAYQTQFRGVAGTDFWIDFGFDKPVFFGNNNTDGLWLTVSETTGTKGGTVVQLRYNNYNVSAIVRYSGGEQKTEDFGYVSAILAPLVFDLYGARFLQVPSPVSTEIDSTGLGASTFAATQTGVTTPLDKLDFVVAVNGLCDSSSSPVSGVAGALLSGPKHVVQMLSREWSGSDWVDTGFDSTAYSATHGNLTAGSNQLDRRVAGRTEGRRTWADIIDDICTNTACRLPTLGTAAAGKLWGIWGWGVQSAVSAVLSDEDTSVENVELRGTGTIVNSLRLYYGRQLRYQNLTALTAEGNFSQYASTLNWYNGANALATLFTSASTAAYGTKQNADVSYDFISASASAEVLARQVLSTYAKPHWYVECTVPFKKYQTLELLNVVEIVHPDLPAYFGTAATADLPSYSGTPVEITQGHYLKRANRYRAQIESRLIDANVRGFPLLRLTLRILDNYPADMT